MGLNPNDLLASPPPEECRGLKPVEDGYYECLKCGHRSGDSWAQCEGSCPVEQSPHYDPACLRIFEEQP
jgi:hypothetical protein